MIAFDVLPEPPPGKEGWPWTPDQADAREEILRAADHAVERRRWPRITVVTPSYNQVDFLEETIRSVLLQDYPDLEYIVIDGGSDDGSREIIEKYSPWLAYWCSEPDRGQSHAINKGFRHATGEILGWINSDDILYPGALRATAKGLASADIFWGAMDKVRTDGNAGMTVVKRSTPFEGLPIHRVRIQADGAQHTFHFYQPSMFWTRRIWDRTGELDERYHYVMDVEWCNRALARGAVVSLSERPLARFLLHDQSKSVALEDRFSTELVKMYLRLGRRPEFRFLPCLQAALRPAQVAASSRAHTSGLRGGWARALGYRTLAKAMRMLRTLLPEEVRSQQRAGSAEDG